MKKTKFIAACIIAISLAAVLPMAASAWSRHGGGFQSQMQTLTPEKQIEFSNLMTEHMAKMRPAHEELWTKETTLRALSANPNTRPEQLTALINEIGALRKQIGDERLAFSARIKSDIGFDPAVGYGPGSRLRHGGYGGCGGYGGYGNGR